MEDKAKLNGKRRKSPLTKGGRGGRVTRSLKTLPSHLQSVQKTTVYHAKGEIIRKPN